MQQTIAATSPSAYERPLTGFRPDIQGLRSIAVGVVLLYHANAPFLPGGFVGVDVFFVISGYLITGLLLREALRTGRIDLADFYARRARRILPAATIVLVATLVLTVLFLPQIRWQQIGTEALGAAVYVVNWMFAGGTDYLNADVAASPLQHFWTLSVEEQFYILWPLVLVLLLLGLRKAAPRRVMRFAALGVLLILLPSLAWSVHYTAVDAAPAYFVTTTRLWELAIGAALAVFAAQAARLPDVAALVLGWLGLAGILAASVLYTSSSPAFPGSAALLPTLSTAAVIVSGMNGRAERGVGRMLCVRPMRWLGDISYSLYLWHWPLIVVGTYLLGGELRFRWGLVIVMLAVVPAWLSYRFVETPFRDWPRLKASAWRSLRAGAALMAVTAVVAAAVIAVPRFTAVAPAAVNGESVVGLGAEALIVAAGDDESIHHSAPIDRPSAAEPGDRPSTVKPASAVLSDAGAPVDEVEGGFVPAAIDAREDNPAVYDRGCHLDQRAVEPKLEGCVFGDPTSEIGVALVGDSHAASWMPALARLADEHGWRLFVSTKSSCAFSSAPEVKGGEEYASCSEWNERLLDALLEEQPELVVTVNTAERDMWQDRPVRGKRAERLLADGFRESWSALNEAGIPVVALRDTPRMSTDVPECVSAHPDRLTKCATPRDEAIDTRFTPETDALEGLDAAEVIDMNDWLCPDAEACAPVIGNVLVWRDAHHLTASYAETLARPLEATLRETRGAETLFEESQG